MHKRVIRVYFLNECLRILVYLSQQNNSSIEKQVFFTEIPI